MRRPFECGVRFRLVADVVVVGDIVRRTGEDERRSRPHGLFHVDRGGKLLPGDADEFGGVPRRKSGLGDHHREDVADMMDLVGRHHRVGLERRFRLVGVGNRGKAGHGAEIGEIAGEIDGLHPRRGARGFDILDAEFRVPVGAAQKDRPQRGGLDRVGGVVPPAADQANILDPLDALADPKFHRFHTVSIA